MFYILRIVYTIQNKCKGALLDIILLSKRAKDGKITEQKKTCESLDSFASGCNVVLKTKLITGYCIKDAKTGKILIKKGDI